MKRGALAGLRVKPQEFFPCGECNFPCKDPAEYHPYAFCRIVKAGLNPETIVRDALPYLRDKKGLKTVREVK